jgi:O-antigen/teichoic acid export membrane protein
VVATLIFVGGAVWTSSAVVRYGREAVDADGTMLPVTWERIVLTVPALGAAAGVAFLLRAVGLMPNSLSWTLVMLAVTYGVALALSDHVVYALQAVGRMKRSAWAAVLRQGVAVPAIGGLALMGVSVTPAVVALVLTIGCIAMAVVVGRSVWRQALWPPTFDSKLRRRILRFSLPLVAFTVSQYLISTIDLLVLAIYTNDAQVGLYALAYQAYMVLQNIGMAAGTVLVPLFISLRRAGRDAAITMFAQRFVPQLTFLVGTLLGICAPFVALAVPAIFGSAFRQAADPLTILLIPLALSVTCYVWAAVIVLHEETAAAGRVSVLAALVNVVADLVLIGPAGMGMKGAAVATAGSIFILAAGYARIVARCTQTPLPVGKIALVAPLLVGTLATVGRVGWGSAAAAAVATAVVAAVVVFVGRVFEPRDAELLANLRLPDPIRRALVRSILLLSRA